jgi:hypothetical protein
VSNNHGLAIHPQLTPFEPKRSMSDSPRHPSPNQLPMPPFLSPKDNNPEMPSLTMISRHDDTSLVSEGTLPYYLDSASHDNALQQVMEHPTPGKLDNVFPSSGLNLEMDDFQWFSATPTATGMDLSTHHETISGVSSSHPSAPPSMVLDQANTSLESCSSLSPPGYGGPQHGLPCLCDPLSLGIISELHTLQISFSPLDTALLLARRGLTTVSSYLSCPSCLNHLGNSPSLFLACVLILQQVFACYITLRVQGTKSLTSAIKNEGRNDGHYTGVSIGEFEVEGEESCNVLLDAIVRAEMERGKGVIGGLEQWAEKVGEGKEKMAGILLQSLREEIGGVC